MKTAARIMKGLLVTVVTGLSATTLASPMTYTAVVVTDVRLDDDRYHNAIVTLTFEGDTRDIAAAVDGQGQPVQSTFCSPGTGWFFWLNKGKARVKLESGGETLIAHLHPNQVFVALDACSGGIGFGSFTGPNGLEPAYPLAFTRGTADHVSLGTGLSAPASVSGTAWSCIGYPPITAGLLTGNNHCNPPDAYPLHSDVGDLFFYQPYEAIDSSSGFITSNRYGSLNRGTFTIAAGRAR